MTCQCKFTECTSVPLWWMLIASCVYGNIGRMWELSVLSANFQSCYDSKTALKTAY